MVDMWEHLPQSRVITIKRAQMLYAKKMEIASEAQSATTVCE
jgi:hypothetical protein